MSVMNLSKQELTKLSNTLSNSKEVIQFVKESEKGLFSGCGTQETIERAIWYGYIANVTAFNVQYKQNCNIDYSKSDDNTEFDSMDDAMSVLSSLIYNVFTNDGNFFLNTDYLDLLKAIIDKFEDNPYR
tara:strand:- start:6874 stop:7260 length:387 start_codon:yes stop_codon:yes gene_type:complete